MNYFRCGGGRSTHTATKIDVAKTPLATFESNVSGLYIPEILAYIQATQSGTGDPSPSNIRPITGRTSATVTHMGKNLFSYDLTIRDGYWSDNSFVGTNAIVPKESAVTWQYIRVYVEGLSSITLSGFDNQGGTNCAWLSSDNPNDIISLFNSSNKNGTKTIPSGAKYLGVVIYSITTKSTTYPNAQLEVGSSATTYEPYTGTTATTALGGTYYGGYLNVGTGVLTVTHGIFNFDGSDDETWYNSEAGSQGYTSNRYTMPSNVVQAEDVAIIANIFKGVSFNDRTYNVLYRAWINKTNNSLTIVMPSDYDSSTKFKEFLSSNNLSVVVQITPQTVQLTPAQIEQLLGQNNVFASTGDVAVKYWKID